MEGWIQKDQDPERFYVPLVEEGDVMRSSAISRVIKTGEGAKAKEGDFVLAYPGWRQYAVVDDAQAQILK
jgi:NADPH-dependent curcumin reductase CurA